MFQKYLYKAGMLLVLFSLALSAAGVKTTLVHAADIIYVNTNAAGTNDGSSWSNAYLTLQDALAAAASGDQVWVAAGVYYPDAGVGQINNDRMSTFQLIDGVQIYGGFVGTEALLSERNISANVTILSGDLEQNDTNADADFTAETTGDIIGSNAYHVVRGGDATATSILDGFTITAGNADGVTFDTQNGGGLFNWNTNPTVQNVIFSGNNADEANFGYGGGVYNYLITTPAQFTNVTFTGNNAYAGGGMAGDSDIIVTDSTFINNTASNTGGGLEVAFGSGGTLTDVTFTNNTAAGGGAMSIQFTSPTLTNVTFSNNTADSAGAVLVTQGNPEFINVTFDNNTATDFYGGAVQLTQSAPTFRNVTFSNNSATISGGGIFSSTSSDPTLANVTFTNNSAVNQGGGMYTGGGGDATLTNVTFSNNSANLNGGGLYALNGLITLQNTIIANSTNGGDCYAETATLDGTGHNLIESTGTDACNLVNGVNGNITGSDPILGTLTGSPAYFPLISGSPAINAGDNAACAASPVNNESQNGIPRPQTICDIGSFEALISLTVKSNPTYDGFVRESSETSDTGGLIDSASVTFTIGDDSSDRQHRAILHFDTSTIPDNAIITSTLLKIKEESMAGTNPFTSLVSLYVDLKRPTFGLIALELGDFNAAAKKVKTAVFNSTPSSGWYTARLNNGGLANINLTGSTQLRLYFSLDDNDNAASDFFRMHSGNAAAGDRPKLVIQYYVP